MNTASQIISLAHRIPDVVWAALIAASIAWFTTILSNRNSRKQLRMQLTDSANQRERDRAMALRRDVYLPCVEAIVRAHGAVGQLLDLNADASLIGQQMIDDLATIAKTHLVASERTVRALLAYQAGVMPVYLEASAERAALNIQKSAIATQQSLMDRTAADRQRIVQLMRELNISGTKDSEAMNRLSAQFAIEAKTFDDLATRHMALNRTFLSNLFRVIEKQTAATFAVAKLMPEALLSAREELGLPIDAAEYLRLYEAQQGGSEAVIREFVQQLRTQLVQTDRNPPPQPSQAA